MKSVPQKLDVLFLFRQIVVKLRIYETTKHNKKKFKKMSAFINIENSIRVQIRSIHLNSVFWSQISSFYLQLITDRNNRARTFLHLQTRYHRIYVYDNPLPQPLVVTDSRQTCEMRIIKTIFWIGNGCWRGARSVAYNPFPVGRPHPAPVIC